MNTQTTYLASKPHYEILDGLRGVAAIMVIIFHLFETHSLGNHLIQIINHGYLAVDFFFMLSGFVIGYAYDDRWDKMTLGTFFKRRIIRLHPMVIMGSIVGAALFYFQQSSCFPQIEHTSVGALLLIMLLVQSPNQKIPDRKTKCVIKTHINIKQNVIFGAKLKPV